MPDASRDDELADNLQYRAGRAGVLPAPGPSVLGDVVLPAGDWIVPDPAFARESDEQPAPVGWITDDVCADVAELWLKLRDQFPHSGLWPLVLDTLWGSDERPWKSGELDPYSYSAPDAFDPGEVLAACWAAAVPDAADDPEAHNALLPFTTFPGLVVPPAEPPPDPKAPPHRQDAAEIVVRGLKGRLGLVAVERPADAVATLGWQGPSNRFLDSGALAAVLRSWEVRFRAVPVGLGFDTLVAAAHRPPFTDGEVLGVAAEHFAVCPDLIWQETGTIAAYANRMRGRKAWTFWWS